MYKLKINDKVKCRDGSQGLVSDIEYDMKGIVSEYYVRIKYKNRKLDQAETRLYSYTDKGEFIREDYSIPHKYDLIFKKEKLNLPQWW